MPDERLHDGQDGRDHGGQVAGKLGAVVHDVDRGLHRTTFLVTEHDDDDTAEIRDRVLDAADDERVLRGVARDPHGEQHAEALVVDDFGWHA